MNLSSPDPVARAAAIAMTLALAGCNSVGNSNWVELYKVMRASWSNDGRVTLEQASKSPYASIGLRVGGSTEVMLLLATDNPDGQLWTSAAKITIVTRKGRIVRTAGLGKDLVGFTPRSSDPGLLAGPHSFSWTADFSNPERFGVAVTCRDGNPVPETISVLGTKLKTLRIEERCSAKPTDWSFTNTFWISPTDGMVWRSIQYVHPDQDALRVETLRPPE